MALSTTSAMMAVAPGLLAALQHLPQTAGVAAVRKAHSIALGSAMPRLSSPAVADSAQPASWHSSFARALLPAPAVRFNSTLTPMTMDPSFAPNTAAGQDLLSTLSSYVSQNVEQRQLALPKLAEELVHFAPQLPPEDLAQVVVHLANMGFSHTGLTSAVAMQVTLRMPMCSPEAVAKIAWAFGELQYYNYQFLGQLVEYLKNNYANFSAPDLARVLWALSKLGYHHELMVDMYHELSLKASSQLDCKAMADIVAAEALSGGDRSDDVTLQNMIADYAAANLHNFDADDLGKVAYGLARFCYEDAELYDMMAKRAVEIWDTLRPVDVRRIMTAYADMSHFQQDLLDVIADKWLVAHVDDPDLQMPELRLIVRSFNVLGYSNPNIAEAVKHRMPPSMVN